MRIIAAIVAVFILAGLGAAGADPRFVWDPIQRALCIGLTDDACTQFVWPTDRNALGVVVGTAQPDQDTSDASFEVHQLSTIPNDPRALACFNVGAVGGFGQFCAYGANYPGAEYRGRMKLAGYGAGIIMQAYSGDIAFKVGEEIVAVMNGQGLGIFDVPGYGGGPCRGCLSLGIGTPPSGPRPWWGYDVFAKIAPDGIVRPHVRHSDGTITCLTC